MKAKEALFLAISLISLFSNCTDVTLTIPQSNEVYFTGSSEDLLIINHDTIYPNEYGYFHHWLKEYNHTYIIIEGNLYLDMYVNHNLVYSDSIKQFKSLNI